MQEHHPSVVECKSHKKVQFISSLTKGIESTNSSVQSTDPYYINKSTSPFMDMEFFSFNLNHKVNTPFTKNLAKSENKNSCNNTNTLVPLQLAPH